METSTITMKQINSNLYMTSLENCESLKLDSNKFIANLANLKSGELQKFLGQYCHFPRHIISILVSACYSFGYYEWNDVAKELRKNINEELGAGYEPISEKLSPHYSILRRAIKDGLSIDISEVDMHDSTRIFIDELNECMNKSVLYTAGAVYALEATAIPELKIVYDLTTRLFEMNKLAMPKLLTNFFEFHIDEIEIEHRDRLLDMLNKYIAAPNEVKEFDKGFNQVLSIMDRWWKALYNEVTE